MRKFIVYTPRSGKTTIMEVEVELVTQVEDVSIGWLPIGEFKARIIEPKSLYDESPDKTLSPPIWYSHAFYWTISGARVAAEKIIRSSFEFKFRKHGVPFTEEEVKAKFSEIEEVRL